MLHKLILIILIICSPMSFANKVTIPQNAQLHYQGESDGTFKFSGQIKLTGLLKAQWGKDLASETNSKKLYLHFFPLIEQTALFPVINDQYKNSNKMISINNQESQQHNEKLIKQNFKNIPTSFWQYKEGMIQQPVTITMTNFSATDDCDYRYYYAQSVTIETAANIGKVTEEKTATCNSYLFNDNYLIQSKEGYTNLRQAANSTSIIIKQLPNNTLVNKIKTAGNWYYVNVLDTDKKTDLYGYVHKGQLILAD